MIKFNISLSKTAECYQGNILGLDKIINLYYSSFYQATTLQKETYLINDYGFGNQPKNLGIIPGLSPLQLVGVTRQNKVSRYFVDFFQNAY